MARKPTRIDAAGPLRSSKKVTSCGPARDCCRKDARCSGCCGADSPFEGGTRAWIPKRPTPIPSFPSTRPRSGSCVRASGTGRAARRVRRQGVDLSLRNSDLRLKKEPAGLPGRPYSGTVTLDWEQRGYKIPCWLKPDGPPEPPPEFLETIKMFDYPDNPAAGAPDNILTDYCAIWWWPEEKLIEAFNQTRSEEVADGDLGALFTGLLCRAFLVERGLWDLQAGDVCEWLLHVRDHYLTIVTNPYGSAAHYSTASDEQELALWLMKAFWDWLPCCQGAFSLVTSGCTEQWAFEAWRACEDPIAKGGSYITDECKGMPDRGP